jgi:hypothetical protein
LHTTAGGFQEIYENSKVFCWRLTKICQLNIKLPEQKIQKVNIPAYQKVPV